MPTVEPAGTTLFLKRWLRRPFATGAVVSSLPLLSLPADVVNGIVGGVFEALPRGAAVVQFTYGPKPPIPRALRQRLHLVGAHGKRIWRNVPPAVVWTFTRPAA